MTKVIFGTRGYEDAAIERDVFGGDTTVITTDTSDPDEFVEAASDAEALLNPPYPTPGSVFERMGDLRAVGICGIGFDHVALEAATEHGVQVVHVPDYCIEEVSTHALALLLAVARHVVPYDEHVQNGGWDWTLPGTLHRLAGRTLGFVGFGDIARRLAEKVSGFDLTLVAYDPYVDPAIANQYGVELVSFEGLLERATLLSVHAPLTEETYGLVDQAAFEMLDSETIVVDTARAPIIDRTGLETALENNEIFGVGLDVWWNEPPEDTSLAQRDDVIATPHAAFLSETAHREARRRAAADVERILQNKSPENPVNELDQ